MERITIPSLIRFGAIFCLATLAVTSLATESNVEELLYKMRSAYKTIKTAEFTVETKSNTRNGPVEFKIHGTYMNPGYLHAVSEGGGGKRTVITDGYKIYVTLNDGDQASVLDFDPDQLAFEIRGLNLESLSFFDWKRQLTTHESGNMATSGLTIENGVKWNDKLWIVLKEEAPSVGVAVDYYIDPKTYLIHRTVNFSLDRSQQLNDYRITSLKLNIKVDVKLFANPNKG